MDFCPEQPKPRIRAAKTIEIRNKLKSGHDECCNCCCCKIPQFQAYKYIQPERPQSYAPLRCYLKSDWPMEDATTYKLSFWNNPADVRKPIKQEDCLTVCDGPFARDTTHKLSYMGNYCVKPTEMIMPCSRDLLGRGPMQDCTTQKHDFNWKYCTKSSPVCHNGNLCLPNARLSEDTTYRLSYFDSNCLDKVISYKPIRVYKESDVPLEDCTTYKLSFFPSKPTEKEHYPWKDKLKYQAPTTPVDSCTTYKLSYWPNICVERPKQVIHDGDPNILNRQCGFDDDTTYQLSYFNNCNPEKSKQIIPEDNLMIPNCPFTHDTVNKLSYMGNWCPNPQKPIIPCTRDLLGRGPIQDCTTQKHDFNWKWCCPVQQCIPPGNLEFSPAPLSTCTTNRLSYMPNCGECLLPAKSFAPIREYLASDVPMDCDTVNALSFQPKCPEKIEKPWAEKLKYTKPATNLDSNTTYSLSYFPPGTIVPCPTAAPITSCPTNTCSKDCKNFCPPKAAPCVSC